MKVLLITVRADIGGGPEHVYQLMSNAAQEMEWYVACPHEEPYYARYKGIAGNERMFEVPHRAFSFRKLMALRHFVKSQKIDIIHSHGKGAGLYGRTLKLLTGVPCVHTFHGLQVGEYSSVKRALYLALERCLGWLSRRILAVSQGEAGQMRNYRVCAEDKIRVIPNGVAVPEEMPQHALTEGQPLTIVHISRCDYAKNSEALIPIADELRAKGSAGTFKLVVVGDGPGLQAIRDDVTNVGLDDIFIFAGAVDDVRPFFKDAFCYLSTSRWEGMPLALLEAMAHGVPVIATDVVGNNDLISDGSNGMLFPVSSPRDAAELLCKLASDPQRHAAYAAQGYQQVKEFHSAVIMAQQVLEVYREVA